MFIGKIAEAIAFLEESHASFSEEEKLQIALYAFKTGDDELLHKLVEELTVEDADKTSVFQKYFAITDVQEPWIEQMERLLVSIEMLRLKEKQALDLLFQVVKAYEKEIYDNDREEVSKGTHEETKKCAEESAKQQKVL